MRIVMLSHYALPHTGGIEVVVDALARRLAAAGHLVTHVCSSAVRSDDPLAGSPTEMPYERVLLPALNVLESYGIPYPVFGPRLASRLWREIGAADIVHAHGLLYETSVAAAIIAAARHKPVVVTEHVGYVPYSSVVLRWLQAIAFATIGRVPLAGARRLLVLNGRVEREMRRLSRRTTIVRLWNGVDTNRYRPPRGDERSALRSALGWDDSCRLLLAGRLVEKKGIGVAIAAAEILGSRFALTLVGPGEVKQPLPANVTVAGAVAPERLAVMYRAADALVLPSRGEGFPLAVQEALASGLPVFVPRDEEFAGVLSGAEPAVQWIEADPRSIADRVSAYFAHRRDRVAGAVAAASFAREQFGWEAAVQRHVEIYREVIEEQGGKRG